MKYELLKNQSITFFGQKLFRIKALISFGSIKRGEIGGYVEAEENLDQSGNAWVYGDAWVSGNARVSGDAWVYGDAWVSGDAQIINTVINLIGVCAFNVTAYGHYLQVGCELHTFAEWHKILKKNEFKSQMKSHEYQACIAAGLLCEKAIKREILFRKF